MTTDSRIPRRWRPWIRAAWLLLVGFVLVLTLTGIPYRLAELRQLCAWPDCPSLVLTAQEAALLNDLGRSLNWYAAFQLTLELLDICTFSAMGLLIFWRKGNDWIGILTSLELMFIGLIFYPDAGRALARAFPVLEPALGLLTSITVVLFMLLFFLFPDGRFAPRWLGYVAAILIAIVVLEPLLNPDGAQAASASMAVVVAGVGGAVLGLTSQRYRYVRVSAASQRQQTKWVLLGFLCMMAASLVWVIFAEVAPLPPGQARLWFNLSIGPQYLVLTVFPVSLAVSILRYRLYEIDVLIRRTLVYTLLTGALALVYFGSVVVVQAVVNTFTGRSATSPLTIVLSTLVIAALFNPLRRRLQTLIDRRFYRRKYDAAQTLARFSQTARDEVELENLTAAMRAAVNEALEPATLSIWLPPPAGSRPTSQQPTI